MKGGHVIQQRNFTHHIRHILRSMTFTPHIQQAIEEITDQLNFYSTQLAVVTRNLRERLGNSRNNPTHLRTLQTGWKGLGHGSRNSLR